MLSQEFLVDILVKSTLLLFAAVLVDWMLYWTSAAARHLLWAATFLTWYALRRLRIERELACDDCVLMSGALPSSYASELLTVARECQAMALSPAVAMAQPSGLEKRIRALFDKTRSHLPVSYRRRRIVMLGILAAVTLLAIVRLDAVAEPPTAAMTDQAASDEDSDDPLLTAGAIARLGTTDLRNYRGVTAVAFSPDGEQLVSSGWWDTIRFWDVTTGRQLKQFRAGTRVYSIAFSPDGTKLVSAGDGDVRLWDFNANEELFVSERHPGRITNIVFAPDGLTFVTAGQDEAVRLWEAATGEVLVNLHTGTAGRDSRPLVFSPDGRLLALGDRNGEIRVWDLDTGTATQFSGEQELRSLTSLAFTPDGQHIVSAGERYERDEGRHVSRSSLSIWRVTDGKTVDELSSEDVSTLGSCSMVMTSDGESVVSSHREQIVVWDLAAREPRRIIDHPVNSGVMQTHGLAVSPDGRLVAAAGSSHKVYLWNVATGEELFPQSDSHHGAVLAIDTSPDQSLIVSGGEEGAVHLWDAHTYNPVRRLTRTGNWIRAVQFFPDGQRVLAVGERSGPGVEGFQGLALVLRVSDGAVLRRLELPDRGMQATLSADGNTLAVAMGMNDPFGDGESSIRIGVWDLPSKIEPFIFPSGGEVKHLSFDSEANNLYGISGSGEIRRWEVSTGELKETKQIETEPRFGASPMLSLTGQFALYGGLESGSRKPSDRRGHLVMADMQTGKRVWSQETTEGWPKSVTVSPDGKHYAAWYSVGREMANPLIVGRVSDGKELARFDLSDGMVRSLAFSRDGRKLFSGMERGDVLVWKVPRF